jgi:signal transduction histidine kinase
MKASTLWRLGIAAAIAQVVLLSLPLGPFPFEDDGTSRLSVHLLLELVAITVGILVVTVSWHTHDERPSPELATLVGGLSFVVICDVMHALVFKGMPAFLGESSSQRSIYFWLMGRTGEWLTLLLIATGLGPRRRATALASGLGFGLLAVVHGSTGTWGMPVFLVPGQGLTAEKVAWEWILCLANVALAVHLWRRAAAETSPTESQRLRLFATSAWVMGIGELAFTAYQSPSDLINIVGHVFKVVAYGLIYLGAYAIALKEPFEALRRSRSEALAHQSALTDLTQRLMAQERETTRRLAQLMHDQLGQTLAAMRIDFVTEARWPDPDQAARHDRVDRLLDQAVKEVRQLLVELRPTLLDDEGVAAALDNELRVRRRQPRVPTLVLELGEGVAGRRWPAEVEYAVFMVAREGLANAVMHAAARRITLRLEGDAGHLRLQVQDDGRGLKEPAPAERVGHLGLVGMRERAVAIGARLDISSAPGAGTTVQLDWAAPPAPVSP